MSSEPIIIEGRDNIRVATLLALASALALEMTTGLVMSRHGTALDGARAQGIIPKGKRGNKKQALELTVAAITDAWPEYTPTTMVRRALGHG